MAKSLEAMRVELNAAVAGVEPGFSAANELCAACVGLFGVDGAAVSMIRSGASQGTFGSSNEASRRLDEYQFTFGEGPCLDAVTSREPVLVPDLGSPHERRWPVFTEAVLEDGIRGVFALPIMITSEYVGALDLFRADPGPLGDDQLAGARIAADLASLTLLDLQATPRAERDVADDLAAGLQGDAGTGARVLDAIDRVEVYQATGMLIAQLDVSAAEALVRLRAHAIATGQTASEVAQAVLQRRLVLDRDDPDGNSGRRG